MSITISRALRFAFAFALVLSISTEAQAQISLGKISGVVVDSATREPLPAASVRVEGTVMGAMANDMGEYFILNVPPGTYTLVVNVIGYVPVRAIGTRVDADITTTLNFELESTILESAEAVEVVATRDLVEKSLTSTRTIVQAEEIQGAAGGEYRRSGSDHRGQLRRQPSRRPSPGSADHHRRFHGDGSAVEQGSGVYDQPLHDPGAPGQDGYVQRRVRERAGRHHHGGDPRRRFQLQR